MLTLDGAGNGHPFSGVNSIDSLHLGRTINGEVSRTFGTGITHLTISDSVTSIRDGMFWACAGLTSVTIPSSVTAIGVIAFRETGLTSITNLNPTPQGIDATTFQGVNVAECRLHVPKEGFADYQTADIWKNFDVWSRGNCDLTSLSVSKGTLSPEFDAEITTYSVSVHSSVNSLIITAESADEQAPIDGTGEKTIDVTGNVFDIVVTARDGTIKTYTIHVVRFPFYDVTFNSQGGSSTPSQNIEYGEKANEPTIPNRTGYTFDGWYTSETYNIAWNFETDVVTSDTTLYAKWNINTFTVTFNSQKGSNVSLQTIDYNEKVIQPANPEREYFLFGGWYKETECVNAWDFNVDVVTADITLYAKWSVNPSTMEELVALLYDSIATLNVLNTALQSDTTKLHSDTLRLHEQVLALQSDTAILNTNIKTLQTEKQTLTANNTKLISDTVRLYNLIALLELENNELNDSIIDLLQRLADCESGKTANTAIIPQEQISVYPNPINSSNYELKITNYEFKAGDVVELFDMNGKRVYYDGRGVARNAPTTEFSINMSPFPTGNYILKIGNRVAKIVKQ